MALTRTQIIAGVVGVVVVIGVAVGIYFAVAGGSSDGASTTVKPPTTTEKPTTENPEDQSNDKLLVKSNDGLVRLYDRSVSKYTDTKIEEPLTKVISFGPYLDQTIYYATTGSSSVVKSTKNGTYPNLPDFTAEWIKTAIAVDEVTLNVYVVDRVAAKIYVVSRENQYALPLTLTEPKDVILAPEKGKLYVLEESKIITADMDGSKQEDVLTVDGSLQAFAVDSANKFLYFAHAAGIESLELASKKRLVINSDKKDVSSLAYADARLYFVDRKSSTSSQKTVALLDTCRLDDSKCMDKCCSVVNVQEGETLEQVKVEKTEKPQVKNPCETLNGDCEQLCLLSSSEEGRSCRCTAGWQLKDDGKTCEKEADQSNDKLLVKSNDGRVRLYDRSVSKYTETKIDEKLWKVLSFGPYLDQTIYYATTESSSVVMSTNNATHPNLPAFTADWIKTAIAVDEVTGNVYVVDRVEAKIYVVNGQNQYALPLTLTEPKDVILAPEKGKLYVLEESKIIMADMDGSNQEDVLTVDDSLQAFAVDSANKFLYFAHAKGIESLELGTKQRTVINADKKDVSSLAYADARLYFVDRKVSSQKTVALLDTCRLDDSRCVNQCCSVFNVVQDDETLEKVKVEKTDKPQVKNPCETKNGDCEQLCLLSSSEGGRSCRCKNGWKLKGDGKTCEEEAAKGG